LPSPQSISSPQSTSPSKVRNSTKPTSPTNVNTSRQSMTYVKPKQLPKDLPPKPQPRVSSRQVASQPVSQPSISLVKEPSMKSLVNVQFEVPETSFEEEMMASFEKYSSALDSILDNNVNTRHSVNSKSQAI